jgi:hypothetical protein
MDKQISDSIITPEFFLNIYKIYSFYDAIQWLKNNKHVNILTQSRVIDVCLILFGVDISITDPIFILFFHNLLDLNIYRIYNGINKSIELKTIKSKFLNLDYIKTFLNNTYNAKIPKIDIIELFELFINKINKYN